MPSLPSAFEFVECVGDAHTLKQLEKLFVQYTKPFGVEFYLCGQLVLAGGHIKTVRFVCSENHPWFKHYEKANLYLDDPAVRISRNIGHPFRWSWLLDRVKLSQAERNVFDEAARFGLIEGLVFPIHGPFGALAGGSMSGKRMKLTASIEAALSIIMNATHRRGLEITELMDYKLENPLSLRQRECLNWAQHGKSVQEIADILDLSPHTVKEHLDGAKAALGVNTRIEAIVRARNANYIGFSPLSDRVNKIGAAKKPQT